MTQLDEYLLSGRLVVAFGSGMLLAGVVLWTVPKLLKRDFEQELKEDDARIVACREAGKEAEARGVIREKIRLRSTPARGVGMAVVGTVLIIVGLLRMK